MPRASANDDAVSIVEWRVGPGAKVKKGEVLCVAETSKATFEVEAPASGFLVCLPLPDGRAEVGRPFAAVTQNEKDTVEEVLRSLSQEAAGGEAARPHTKKAELLALRHGINIVEIHAAGKVITEADVLAVVAKRTPASSRAAAAPDNRARPVSAGRSQRLLIVGGGDGAVQVIDVLRKTSGQYAVAIVDDDSRLHRRFVMGTPVTGPVDLNWARESLEAGGFDAAVISVSTSIPFRQRIFETWSAAGIPFANVVHPTTAIGAEVRLGAGNVVMAFCQFGACAAIGDNNFLSAYVSIEHHCRLGNHCSFGPAVVMSSRVTIGDRVKFGSGIFIEPKLAIGADSILASGAIVTDHIPENSLLKVHNANVLRQRPGQTGL
jgi:sugar O-acyltransferase (sialic acid O-acetyltransferase NeuD family)